jgi:hypothetical protein
MRVVWSPLPPGFGILVRSDPLDSQRGEPRWCRRAACRTPAVEGACYIQFDRRRMVKIERTRVRHELNLQGAANEPQSGLSLSPIILRLVITHIVISSCESR